MTDLRGPWLADELSRGLLEAAPDAIIVVDRDGRILLVNGQTERLFGYSRAELLGLAVEVLVPARLAGGHPEHRRRYVADPHLRPMGAGLDLLGRRKDGTEFPVEISLSPLRTEHGLLVTSAVRDITDRKRLEENIREQNQALERQNRRIQEASRMKSEFLANMSHELRTPLNSIIGFAELMYDGRVGALADQHREFLGDILTSGRHLLQLINDVLDLSKIEAGKMEFFPESVDLHDVVADVSAAVRPMTAARRIRLTDDIAPAAADIHTDRSRLMQVLYNFVSNALKFTAEGGHVHIRASLEGPDHVRMEVEDDGMGIDAQDFDRLFVEFQQLEAGAAKRFGGTGLGLALTKRIVEAQGGRVGVESVLGRGSTFHAVLPRRAQESA
jgi:protein-histidine pros-kinase